MKRLLSTCLGMAAFVSVMAQCSVIEIPLAQRANASSLIVEGKVINQYSYWNTSHTMIYTANEIELYKIFKGTVNTSSIEIITEGGIVNLDKIVVEPTLELQVGQIGMFTCSPVVRAINSPVSRGGLPRFEAYASLQGFVKYDLTNQTASDPFRTYNDIQTEVYNVCAPAGHHQYIEVKEVDLTHSAAHLGNPPTIQSISGFSPSSITAGTGSVLTINGSGFGATQGSGTVGFKNADDGGATYINPLASQYLSWSNTQITVEVPQNAGTGTIQVTQGTTSTSSSTLTITYAHLNVDFDPGTGTVAYETDHINDNASGGYTWRMNTGFDGDASARASFMRAFDTWRCNTSVNWTIGATTSINDAVSDGTNIICFDNTAPLSAGILGVCYSYWSGCASGPTIVWYVNELDIIFDEGSNIAPLTWEYGPATPSGSEYDFETVAVHELGHGHQLGHVISPGAIMHYAISNGTSNRSLGANDLAGGQFVQAKSIVANVCGPGAMTNYSCASPPVAAFTGTPTTVCAGETVAFTDQSTNTPTSWSWTFTGGTPSSSTAQNPTITYNTPGTYAVSLTATNSSGSDNETISGYITVNANPTVSFSSSPSPAIVCDGETVTLSGSGAVSYSWSGGVTNAVAFTPASSGNYTVTGTDGNGCTGTDVASVTVNATPTLSIVSNPPSGTVCSGSQATLTASGAQSYSWTGGITNGVAFTPASTTTYTVTGTGANGCTSTDQATITVQACAGPTTTVPCGNTYYNFISTISAANVTGATSYRFTFYDNVTLAQVAQRTQTSRTLTFSNVSGIYFNTTYRLTVAVNTGSGFGAESSINCTVIFGIPQPVVPCGLSFSSLNSSASASNTAGAVNYRFTFYDNVTLAQVAQVTQSTRTIVFGTVPGIYNNNTYRYTVAIEYALSGGGTAFGPESSIGCTVSFGSGQTTLPCGNTYTNMATNVTVPSIYGAVNYRFTFYDNVTLAQVAQRTQTSNTLLISNVTGIYYGNTYRWTVAVEYFNGTSNVFGPESSINCTVTFGAPQTVVPCGGTYNMSGYASATAKPGAVNYRFRFYQAAVLIAERTQASRTLYFNTVAGLTAGAYMWTVEIEYNNGTGLVFGPASAQCAITLASAAREMNPDEITAPSADYDFIMYPNPLGNAVNPVINISGADQQEACVTVFDLTGRVITTYQVFVEGDNYSTELSGFPELVPGMYIMQVQVGDQVKSQRFVAE